MLKIQPRVSPQPRVSYQGNFDKKACVISRFRRFKLCPLVFLMFIAILKFCTTEKFSDRKISKKRKSTLLLTVFLRKIFSNESTHKN